MEIVAAALRWHTARHRRIEIGAEQRWYQEDSKRRTGFGGSSTEIGPYLTEARWLELAAARALFKLCEAERLVLGAMPDGGVVDVVAVWLLEFGAGEPTHPRGARNV
jgi:hypothetical protein